ncbi:hypothetical protein BH23VER1_BH23VER1_06060 [soil metagenome]
MPRTPQISPQAASALVLVALLAAAGCSKDSPTTEALAPERRSAHFGVVASQLDLCGELFGYIDTEGDVERLTETMGESLAAIMAMAPEGAGIPIPEDLDMGALVGPLGFNGLAAIGISSSENPGGRTFRNKTFLYTPGGRQGLLAATGGAPQRLAILDLAPEGSDLLYQLEADMKPVYDIWRSWKKQLDSDPKATAGFDALVADRLQAMSMGVAELLDKTRGHLLFVAKVVPDEPMPIPSAEGSRPPKIPSVDFLLSLQGMPWLIDQIRQVLPPEESGMARVVEDDNWLTVTSPVVEEMGVGIYAPVLRADKIDGTIYLASRIGFLDECLGDGPKIESDADFLSATDGLPLTANSLSYISRETLSTLESVINATDKIPHDPTSGGPPPTDLIKMWLPELKVASAQVRVNSDKGILIVGNAATSHKRTLFTFANPTALAVVASLAVPVFSKIQSRAETVKGTNNVRQAYLALRLFAADEDGAYPGSLEELVDAGVLDQTQADEILTVTDPATGIPEQLVYVPGHTDSSPADTVVLATPVADVVGSRIVAFNDGRVEARPAAEVEALLEAARASAQSAR